MALEGGRGRRVFRDKRQNKPSAKFKIICKKKKCEIKFFICFVFHRKMIRKCHVAWRLGAPPCILEGEHRSRKREHLDWLMKAIKAGQQWFLYKKRGMGTHTHTRTRTRCEQTSASACVCDAGEHNNRSHSSRIYQKRAEGWGAWGGLAKSKQTRARRKRRYIQNIYDDDALNDCCCCCCWEAQKRFHGENYSSETNLCLLLLSRLLLAGSLGLFIRTCMPMTQWLEEPRSPRSLSLSSRFGQQCYRPSR